MRVTIGASGASQSRMFTVLVQGYGAGPMRRAERPFTVPFSRLQSLMQTIAQQGGRIVAVHPIDDHAAAAATPAAPAADQPAAGANDTPKTSPGQTPMSHTHCSVKL